MTSRFAISAKRPADARRMIRSALSEAPAEILECAELLASELVTNAIVHGSSEPVLVLEIAENQVRVEVQDSDPRMDLEPLRVEPLSEHGRGLAIVDALASEWGVEPRSSGKVVWFRLNF